MTYGRYLKKCRDQYFTEGMSPTVYIAHICVRFLQPEDEIHSVQHHFLLSLMRQVGGGGGKIVFLASVCQTEPISSPHSRCVKYALSLAWLSTPPAAEAKCPPPQFLHFTTVLDSVTVRHTSRHSSTSTILWRIRLYLFTLQPLRDYDKKKNIFLEP